VSAMIKNFLKKLLESFMSVIPVTIVIVVIAFFIGLGVKTILMFLVGALLLVVGLALFQLGAFQSTSFLADGIGNYVVKKKKLSIFIIVSILLGFFIIVAEPSVRVLSHQLKDVINPEMITILTVAIGVGLLMTVGLVRILFKIPLRWLLMGLYALTFLLAFIVNKNNPGFIAVAFDSGGFASGPLSVPFIMSLAYGISRARNSTTSEQDSFGLVGVTIIGPIIAILILGLFYPLNVDQISMVTENLTLGEYLIKYSFDMAIAIAPFLAFFIIFQILDFKLSKKEVIKILMAFLYTYLGLVLFLSGANQAFSMIGSEIGGYLASNKPWLLVIVGLVFGLLVAAPEPSIVAVNNQVEEVTAGTLSKTLLLGAISLGVGIALVLSMLRIIYSIHVLWIILPGYLITFGLTFFTPKLFTAIAYDSGSAVSGAMTTAFLMPFAIGASNAIASSDPLLDAYGLVVIVSMAPVICLQILGIVYHRKQVNKKKYQGQDDIVSF
ncbi:MAG: DUF1538 domain-containing protein, partial [Acholeplasmataceae bacterium]|nr:DUF1538 domain-containing protein [Acholeplasmataceae bacterium]